MGYGFNPFTGNFDLDNVGTGTIDGSTGSTDNAIIRADGTGGLTIQSSGVTIDDNNNVTTPETLGSEIAPAISAANWTVNSGGSGTGWAAVSGGVLDKNADGTGTAFPTGTFTITAGVTYKVIITTSAFTAGSFYYTLGGIVGKGFSTAKTVTDYITATTTGKLIITPTNTSRFTISSISVKALTSGANGLSVFGQSTFYSPVNFKNHKVFMNGTGLAFGQSNNQAQDGTANWFFGGAGGTLAHVTGFNLGIGNNVLQNAGAGAANTGIGFNSLSGTLTGNDNLCFGSFAGRDCTTGNNNTYYGSSAGILVQEGTRNVGFGREALAANRRGHYNVAIGYQALVTLTGDGVTDDKNTAIGAFAGYSITTGKRNLILGAGTNSTGTTGSPGITTGTDNVVIGTVTNLGNPSSNIVFADGSGNIRLRYNSGWLVTTSLSPATNDGAPLGTTALQWSDLFLAEGGVINWDNGDATLTQAGNLVTLAGADLAIPRLRGTTAAPTIAGGTGAGTSPTVSVTGTDLAGEITVTTDVDPTTSAVFCTITFTSAFSTAPYVVIYPSNDAAILDLTRISAGMYVNANTTTFTINTNSNTPPSASTEFKFMYHVIE